LGSKPVKDANREPETKWNRTGKWRIKIMKKIIMFVMVLAIAAPALADDLNPPDWAGAPGTIYGSWNFEVEAPSGDTGGREDYPEEGLMVPMRPISPRRKWRKVPRGVRTST